MPNEKSKHKLSGKQQLRVCALLSVGYNSRVCSEMFEEETGIKISPTNIQNNYLQSPKWKKLISYMTKRAQRRTLDHALASKTNRLNLLEKTINEALTFRLDKIYYDKDGNELSRIEKRNIGVIAALMREARAEIEGDKALVDMSKHTHITHFFLPELRDPNDYSKPRIPENSINDRVVSAT